jgi:hypothetical protein
MAASGGYTTLTVLRCGWIQAAGAVICKRNERKKRLTTDKVTSKAIDVGRQGRKKKTYAEDASVFDVAAVVEDCVGDDCVVED